MNLKLSTFDGALATAVAQMRGIEVGALVSELLRTEATIELLNVCAAKHNGEAVQDGQKIS